MGTWNVSSQPMEVPGIEFRDDAELANWLRYTATDPPAIREVRITWFDGSTTIVRPT